MKIPGLTTLSRLIKLASKPITKPVGGLVDQMIKNIAAKFLSSLLKNLIALLVAALTAFSQTAVPVGADHLTLVIWGAILAGTAALISALKRWATFDPAKLGK